MSVSFTFSTIVLLLEFLVATAESESLNSNVELTKNFSRELFYSNLENYINFGEFKFRGRRQVRPPEYIVLRIGAVLEYGDTSQEIAFKKGVEAANSLLQHSRNLRNSELVPEIRRVAAGDSFMITKEVCSLLEKGIVSLIGPSNYESASVVQTLLDRYAVPHIQAQWQVNTQSISPYAVNLSPSMKSFGEALNDYIYKRGIPPHFGIIYNDPYDLMKFKPFFESFSGNMLLRRWVSGDENYKYILKAMKMKRMFHFIVDLPYWKVREFLTMAAKFNLTTTYHQYIFTSWDAELLDLTLFPCNISSISMMPLKQPFAKYRKGAFVESLRNEIFSLERTQHGAEFDTIPVRAAQLYDGILLLAHGLESLARSRFVRTQPLSCSKDKFWHLGHALINNFRMFPPPVIRGLTGALSFDELGTRSNVTFYIHESSLYHGFKQSGFWTPERRFVSTKDFTHEKKQTVSFAKTNVLRVTTKEDPPFVIIKKRDKHGAPLTDINAWDGFCIDILKKISEMENITFSMYLVRDNNYGSVNFTSTDGIETWNGMIGELMDYTRDIAVASLTITYERERVIDFTMPYMNLGLSILFKKPPEKGPDLFAFLHPIETSVWGYMFMAYFAVSCVLFVVARLSPYEWNSGHPCDTEPEELENNFNIANSLWFAIGSLFQQGSDILPGTHSTRLLGGIWWFFTLILISSYTANLAAFLTVSRMKIPIESVEDLAKQTDIKYGPIEGGSSYSFFKNAQYPTFQKMWDFMSNNEDECFVNSTKVGIDRVRKKDVNYAFILESTLNEYYRARNCELTQVGNLLDNKHYGFGLPRGSIYRELISEAILLLSKNQTIEEFKQYWWYEYNITSEQKACLKKPDKNASLGVEQVGGIFVLLLVGMLFSFPVAIAEFIYKRSKKREKDAMIFLVFRELKFAFTCFGSSKRLKNREAGCHLKVRLVDNGELASRNRESDGLMKNVSSSEDSPRAQRVDQLRRPRHPPSPHNSPRLYRSQQYLRTDSVDEDRMIQGPENALSSTSEWGLHRINSSPAYPGTQWMYRAPAALHPTQKEAYA